MNTEDKLEGMLLKCSSGGLDGAGRVGLGGGGLVVMTLGERSLANHPLLAEDDDDDEDDDDVDDDDDLTGNSLVTHDLIPPEQLMMQEEMIKNGRGGGGEEEGGGGEVGVHFPLKLTNNLPCLLHMPVSSCQLRSRLCINTSVCVDAVHVITCLIHVILCNVCDETPVPSTFEIHCCIRNPLTAVTLMHW